MITLTVLDCTLVSGAGSVNTAQTEQIHALWDDLSDFEVSQSEAAAAHLMQTLVDLARVRTAAWAGALRAGGPDDPLFGWRVAPVKTTDRNDTRINVLGAWGSIDGDRRRRPRPRHQGQPRRRVLTGRHCMSRFIDSLERAAYE